MEFGEQHSTTLTSKTIQEYFKDRSVLITGGTGFVGKVLIEKLLRSCPDVETIYLLIKPRDGCSTQNRLKEICELPLFDTVRKENPRAFDKLQIVEGNIQEDNLNLSQNDFSILVSRVSVVFHVAATVRFYEKLNTVVETNVKGTIRILELCTKINNISAVVYVSTAYSNSDRHTISEYVYPPPYEPENVIDAVQFFSDEMDAVVNKIIGKLPNTYTFTKALAENVVKKYSSRLPVAIIRPSIVSATLREPFPGWIDTINGLSFPMFCGAVGILRSLPCASPTNNLDVIPVDVLSATMIAIAWRTATQTGPRFETVPVYNCTTFPENLLQTGKVASIWNQYSKENPMKNVLWYPGGGVTTLEKHKTRNILCHDIPAKMVYLLNKISGNKLRRLNRMMNVCREGVRCYEFFSNGKWEMEVSNFRLLLEELREEDKEHFFFDMVNINWQKYLEAHYCGMKKFLLKEEALASPETHRKLQRLRLIHHSMQLFGISAICVSLYQILLAAIRFLAFK